MNIDTFDQKGKKLEPTKVDDAVFKAEVNKAVLSQYVYSYLSNQREANAHTKTRAEVSGGGKKPWRQKGTGRARFGSSRNPIWRKGGVAFGPRNDRNWKKAITKNFKKAAMRNALSAAVASGSLKIVDGLSVDGKKPLTKQAVDIKKNLADAKKILLITNEHNADLVNAFGNLQNSSVKFTGEVNAYDILNGGTVVLEKAAVKTITDKVKK